MSEKTRDRERGILLVDQRLSARALPFLERALANDPDDMSIVRNLAVALCDLERFEESLQTIRRAIVREPENAWAHSIRSSILSRLERHDEALASALECVRLAPNVAVAHADIAWRMHSLRRHDAALLAADAAIALDPTLQRGWLARAWASVALRDFARARAAFEAAIRIAPTVESLSGLACIEGPALAIDLYRRALRIDPANATLQNNLVLQLCQAGAWDEAFEAAKLHFELRPHDPIALEFMVRSAVHSGHLDVANGWEARLRAGLEALRGRADEYALCEALADLVLARGDAAQAEALYERALGVHRREQRCLRIGVGRAALAHGNRTKAEAQLALARTATDCDCACAMFARFERELSGHSSAP